MKRLLTILTLFAAWPAAAQKKLPPGPAEIILLRHGEEPANSDDPHLSQVGEQRAKHLVDVVGHTPLLIKSGPPVAIFATQTTPHGNGQRTQETVAPLAKSLNLNVQTPYRSEQYSKLADDILMNRAYSGKTILICWNHEELPQLARALGVANMPARWKGSDYSSVYVITYKGGRARLATMRY